MTQQALADCLFVSRQTVSSWETGRNLPNLEMLANLAQVLGVSTDYLLGRAAKRVLPTQMTCLPTALAIIAIVRLAIPETLGVLRLSDGVISALLGLLIGQYLGKHARYLHLLALVLGTLMVASAWGQILGMAVGNQLAYVVTGALLISDSTWFIFQGQFHWRVVMKSKTWWLVNGIFGLLVVSGVLWILCRRIDGSGHVENTGSRLLALGVLGIVVVGVLLVELVVYLVTRQQSRFRK
jgi:transcriptional regulator with XRE-family HTH domain